MKKSTAQAKANRVSQAISKYQLEFIRGFIRGGGDDAKLIDRVSKLKLYLRSLIIKHNLDPRQYRKNFLTAEYIKILEVLS